MLEKDNSILGSKIDPKHINSFAQLLTGNKDILKTAVIGNAQDALGAWFKTLAPNIQNEELASITNVFLNNKDSIFSLLKGDKTEFITSVHKNDSELNKTIDLLIKNKTKLNELVGLSPDQDFSILKTPEEIKLLAFKLAENEKVLSGVIKGSAEKIAKSFSEDEIYETLNIDKKLFGSLSQSLSKEQKNLSEIVVNSKINEMLLNDLIDIQFFDFGDEALLGDDDNVQLRKKSFSQTTASILDPTLDPRDKTNMTINIFSKDSDEVLWQYIYEDNKTRLYDLSKTLEKVVQRVNQKFPYFLQNQKK